MILITNDDGVQAPGILALKQALVDIDRVVVVAPGREAPRKEDAVPGLCKRGTTHMLCS